jgi:hypothetical protein
MLFTPLIGDDSDDNFEGSADRKFNSDLGELMTIKALRKCVLVRDSHVLDHTFVRVKGRESFQ